MKFLLNEKIYLPIIYIALGILGYIIIKNIINKIIKRIKTGSSVGTNKRRNTIVSLITNIIKYVIAILIILSILGVYGVDTTSILASLGIAAAVIGLAFQDIAKDFISGISIIFDNQYAVGDLVKINNFTGEVIEVGLRTTKIKAYTGEIMILSNSTINEVINYSLFGSNLVMDINVSYNTDIDKLEKVLLSLNDKIKDYEEVKGDITLLGVDSLASSSIVYKISIPCMPTTSFGLKRKMFKLIKQELDNNNIEIPYNKLDVNVRK